MLSRKLKVGGRMFIREPTRGAHSTAVDEIRQLMTKAGMRERDADNKVTRDGSSVPKGSLRRQNKE